MPYVRHGSVPQNAYLHKQYINDMPQNQQQKKYVQFLTQEPKSNFIWIDSKLTTFPFKWIIMQR